MANETHLGWRPAERLLVIATTPALLTRARAAALAPLATTTALALNMFKLGDTI